MWDSPSARASETGSCDVRMLERTYWSHGPVEDDQASGYAARYTIRGRYRRDRALARAREHRTTRGYIEVDLDPNVALWIIGRFHRGCRARVQSFRSPASIAERDP